LAEASTGIKGKGKYAPLYNVNTAVNSVFHFCFYRNLTTAMEFGFETDLSLWFVSRYPEKWCAKTWNSSVS
jgi:hypothetical protein